MNRKLASILMGGIAISMLAASAAAQSSGGGGGGGGNGGGGNGGGSTNRHGGSFNLLFTRDSDAAGSRSQCLGGYNITTYVTTLSVDYKIKNSSLADGTVIYATVYSRDWYTGLPWKPMFAGTSSVLGGVAAFHNSNVITTGVFGLPVVTSVVLTLGDGTVLFTGRP